MTGAIEAGAQLTKQKVYSRVITDSDIEWDSYLQDKQITALVLNTGTRHMATEEVVEKVKRIMQLTRESGIKWFYKKTDSTMRGNIGAELEAFLHSTNQDILPYIPAYPKLQRITRKGYQYIGKTLLHQTIFGNDQLEPVSCSYIPEILKKQTDIELFNSEPKGIFISCSGSRSKKILVLDCQSEEDLKTIGNLILKNGWQKAIAGSAGFIEILPQLLPLSSSEFNNENPRGPLLLINGSLNSISTQQVIHANNHGVTALSLPQSLLSCPDIKTNYDFKRITGEIKDKFKAGKDVIIRTIKPGQTDKINYPDKKNYQFISNQIGRIVSSVLNELPVHTLSVFGGDTLMGVMHETGCEYIEPKSEIIPGVSMSVITFKSGKIHLLSKPGGYGEKDVILKIIKLLNSNI